MNKDIYIYSHDYEKQLLRGTDLKPRPWSLPETLESQCQNNNWLLDIGCGTSYKMLTMHSKFKCTVGLDPSPDMITISKTNIKNSNMNNLFLAQGI